MRKYSVFLILLAVVAAGAVGTAAGYALYWLHGVTNGASGTRGMHTSSALFGTQHADGDSVGTPKNSADGTTGTDGVYNADSIFGSDEATDADGGNRINGAARTPDMTRGDTAGMRNNSGGIAGGISSGIAGESSGEIFDAITGETSADSYNASGFNVNETQGELMRPGTASQAVDIPNHITIFPQGWDANRRQIASDAPADTLPDTLAASAAHRYVLSLFEGYVAVFSAMDGDFDRVMEVTATPVAALSVDERRRLSAGIKIFNDEQLAKILQDYGS